MEPATLDHLPGFRRRFRITAAPGVVCSEVEDDFHCMSVTIHHHGGVATSIEPVLERAPWTTCPGAVERLKQTFGGVALEAFAERGEKRANCTHLHDLATLAATHAFDGEALVYDILVSDPVAGRRDSELRGNGRTVLRWSQVDGQIVEPAELVGMTLDKLNPWIASLDPQRQEAARLLRWATMIANGRTIPLERQSDASRMPTGNCYTFQPDVKVHARRIGVIRDFSRGAAQPLQRRAASCKGQSVARLSSVKQTHIYAGRRALMNMNDMVVISVDDHISEPPDMFKKHLSGDDLASAPKFCTTAEGTNYWEYQGMQMPSVGLNAVVGRVLEEYGAEPTSLDQLRKGCYDPKARVDDMNVNGIAASLNFGSCVGFDGGRFHKAADKAKSLIHMRAYNDWHIDEWCGSQPGRFIPCALLPTWDMKATVEEVKRIAKKGCTAVSLNENPTIQGMPSIHNPYWEPMYKAIVDHDIAICLHIGAGNPAPHASMETPIEAWISTMPISIVTGAADWLNLEALERYPSMKIALSEGGIGWIPYFTERADFSHERHKAWTHSRFKDTKPSEVFKRHFLTCFIDDEFGLKNLDSIGEDMVAYECDYPHSDSLWPYAPERLWDTVKKLSELQIDKITHGNAMRFFNFDPFKHHKRADLTVGALRAKAAADKVDITPRSYGGAKPLADGEAPRVITSGDLMKMFSHHAKGGSKAA